MKTSSFTIAFIAVSLLAGCATKVLRIDGSFAKLEEKGPAFGLRPWDLRLIESVLRRHGEVHVVKIERLPSHVICVTSRSLGTNPDFYEDRFDDADLQLYEIDKNGVVILTPVKLSEETQK